jgi:hypothetical protein
MDVLTKSKSFPLPSPRIVYSESALSLRYRNTFTKTTREKQPPTTFHLLKPVAAPTTTRDRAQEQ